MKNLTQSAIDRQNILNNGAFINKIQEHVGFTGLLYNREYLFTSKMVADFFDVTTRTLTSLLKQHEDEIKRNGYQIVKGQKLKEFKEMFGSLLTAAYDVSDGEINFSISSQITDNQSYNQLKSLKIFNFRAFLNVAMLLTESQKAKKLRSKILDIVIDTLNQKTGGTTDINRTKTTLLDYDLNHNPYKRHEKYIDSSNKEDFGRFLGEKSQLLIARIVETPELLEVFKRLKER